MSETVVSFALTAFVGLIGLGFKWLANQKWAKDAEDQFFDAVGSIAQRTKDKIIVEIAAAKAATSDGGEEITKAEWSQIRQKAYNLLMNNLKGPALEYAKDKGEHLVKGWLSAAIEKVTGDKQITVVAGTDIQPIKPEGR